MPRCRGGRVQKRTFSEPSKWRVVSNPNLWNYVPRRVWVGCGKSRASMTKLALCWSRCTTGSLKGLTRRTCKRPRRCSPSWDNLREHWFVEECKCSACLRVRQTGDGQAYLRKAEEVLQWRR